MESVENIVELKTRHLIYQIISKYPGMHLRGIIKKSKLSEGTVRYHLQYLKRKGLIKNDCDENYIRFYIRDQIGNKDKELMGVLRKEIPKFIILSLLFNMAVSRAKLSKDLEKSPKVIEYHLKTLVDAGLIKKAKPVNGVVHVNHREVKIKEYQSVTNEVVYVLSDYSSINDFFIVNKKWFFDKVTCELINISIDLEKNKPPKKMKSFDTRLDETIDNFYEIFPHPYHG
jgi:DNA-binding transcriptional ArsR family regulator